MPPGEGIVCIKSDPTQRYGQQAGGTHLTGMHTCLIQSSLAFLMLNEKEFYFVKL